MPAVGLTIQPHTFVPRNPNIASGSPLRTPLLGPD
jgi:hypothetical protein